MQTHRSLARHLLEETYETLEAIDTGDLAHLREELGDLLLQVYFHAEIAAQHGDFDIDDVAGDLIAKLVRRNPHVFGDAHVSGAASVNELWESIKATEKRRDSVLDGIPPTLPALLYADKVLDRLSRAMGVVSTGSTTEPGVVSTSSTTERGVVSTGSTTEGSGSITERGVVSTGSTTERTGSIIEPGVVSTGSTTERTGSIIERGVVSTGSTTEGSGSIIEPGVVSTGSTTEGSGSITERGVVSTGSTTERTGSITERGVVSTGSTTEGSGSITERGVVSTGSTTEGSGSIIEPGVVSTGSTTERIGLDHRTGVVSTGSTTELTGSTTELAWLDHRTIDHFRRSGRPTPGARRRVSRSRRRPRAGAPRGRTPDPVTPPRHATGPAIWTFLVA